MLVGGVEKVTGDGQKNLSMSSTWFCVGGSRNVAVAGRG